MKIKLKYLPSLTLTLMTVVSGAALLMPGASAATESADAVVNVNDACGFDSDYSYTSSLSTAAGTTVNTESDTTKNSSDGLVHVTCNNINGFLIQAIGSSPTSSSSGAGVDGATDMYGANGIIPTGTATTGATSNWAMKVTSATVTSPTGTGAPTATVPATWDNTYGAVPNATTTVITYGGSTSATVVGNFRTDYRVYVSSTQTAGSYEGAVKYTIVGN